jgi:membrane protein implicated in regulation of membrane protease activity
MLSYQFYLVVGVVLIALEIVVPGFVLAPLGLAALVTAGVAALTDNLIWQASAFAASAIALFVGFRSWGALRSDRTAAEGTFGLVGQFGVLLETPESLEKPGRVKVFSDEFEIHWDDSPDLAAAKEIDPGSRVRVTRVVGNKVVVHRAQGGS